MATEGERGAIGSAGEDWADSGNIAENQGSGGVEKGAGDFDSLILGGQKLCLHEGSKVAPKPHDEHVQISKAGVGLTNTRKLSTWTRLVRMEVGPVGVLKEGAKSILGKRNNLNMGVDGEVETEKNIGKKGKICENLSMTEAAGVLQHPCREQ